MLNLNKALYRWKEVIIITIFIKILLVIIFSLTNHFPINNTLHSWVKWDGLWYLDIAQNWYRIDGEQSYSIVFYPLYPLLIKLTNFLVNNFPTSSIIVSLFFSLTASIFLFELTLLDFRKEIALRAVWFLNIFPTAYFLQSSYTESLFLTVSLSTVYFYRKGSFILSGISGILTTLTRINGLLLLPLIIFETKFLGKNLIALMLIPLGFFTYLIINYVIFKDLFYFLQPLSLYWYKHFQWPWVGIMNAISLIPNHKDPSFYIYFSEVIAILFIAIMGILIYLKIRRSYGIYVLLNLLLLTSTGFILSSPRYALTLFPTFILLGTVKHKLTIFCISLNFIILLLYFTYLYTQGRWAF